MVATTPSRHRRAGVAGLPTALAILLASGLAMGIVAGCGSGEKTPTDRRGMGLGNPDLSLAERLEEEYLIGPAKARALGYRIDWQNIGMGPAPEHMVLGGDSLYTLDGENFLSRLLIESGDRVWQVQIERDDVNILELTWIRDDGRIYAASGGAFHVVDGASGSLVAKQPLERIANTPPVRHGQFLLYGGRRGELVWHSYRLGTQWRSYSISPTITVPPAVASGYVVVAGADGRIMSLTAGTAEQVWTFDALRPIVAAPTLSRNTAFVASLDQHIRAFDLFEERSPLWEYLTAAELRDSPYVLEGRVYQHVPGRGLLCFEARPLDQPGGVVVWEADGTSGNVIGRRGSELLLWDEDDRVLEVVDGRLGAVIDRHELPGVAMLHLTQPVDGDLYAIGVDGRVIRLAPRD